jgi:prevent-host-death family protein
MNTKTTLSISDARKSFFAIADEVQSPNVYYTLTERGRPKVVILSAERFEALSNQQNIQVVRALSEKRSHEHAWLLRESPHHRYGESDAIASKDNEVFVLKEAPKVLYIDRKSSGDLYQAKELAKAQLYIEIIEKYHYPLYLAEVGRCVRVGGDQSRRYTEADIIVSGNSTNILLLFSVAAMMVYDEHRDKSFEELFELADALSYGTHLLVRLVYYSRLCENGIVTHRIQTINLNKYPSYKLWIKGGRKTSRTIPSYESFVKK